MSTVPPVRPDLDAGGGLPLAPGRRRGAPQHERIAVPAARGVAPGAAATRWPRSLPPLSRPPGHRAAPGAWPTSTGCSADEVFCANGSNEVLQCLLLAFGGPGAARLRLRAHLRAAPPHRADHRHRGGRGWARRRLPGSTPTTHGRCSGRAHPTSPSCAHQTIPPVGPSPERRGGSGGCRTGPGDRRRGLRAVRTLERPVPARAGPAGAGGGRAPSPRRGPWPAPVWATWWPTRRWSRPARPWCCRTTSRCRPSWPDCSALRHMRRDGGAGGQHRRRAGSGGRRPGRSSASTAGPPTPTSSCSGRSIVTRDDGLARPAGTLGPHPQLCELGRAEGLPARSPSARPRRMTVSCTP